MRSHIVALTLASDLFYLSINKVCNLLLILQISQCLLDLELHMFCKTPILLNEQLLNEVYICRSIQLLMASSNKINMNYILWVV